MTKQIALRACIAVALALILPATAFCQSDTTTSPIKLGFFAGPTISKGPLHGIIGITISNAGPIAVATWIDPGDTTFTLTTTSAIKLWTYHTTSLHALIGGELTLIDRPMNIAEHTTYILAATGALIKIHLFDACELLAAGSYSIPDKQHRKLKVTLALHFMIGNKPH